MAVFALILGAVIFLIMEHTLVFWCVFLPLAVIFILLIVAGLKGGVGNFLSGSLAAMTTLFIAILLILLVCAA